MWFYKVIKYVKVVHFNIYTDFFFKEEGGKEKRKHQCIFSMLSVKSDTSYI